MVVSRNQQQTHRDGKRNVPGNVHNLDHCQQNRKENSTQYRGSVSDLYEEHCRTYSKNYALDIVAFVRTVRNRRLWTRDSGLFRIMNGSAAGLAEPTV